MAVVKPIKYCNTAGVLMSLETPDRLPAYTSVADPDPASADFTKANFTADGSWHNDFDLTTGSLPSEGKAGMVLLRIVIKSGTPGDKIVFNKNGNTNHVNAAAVICQVAAIDMAADVWVETDADGKVSYLLNNVTSVSVTCIGYIQK